MSEFVDQGQRVDCEQPATSKRPRRRQRGVALVEFAVVALLLFGLIFGIIGYGYMISFRQAISQGAAEGARAAAVAPSAFTATQKQTLARNAVNQALNSYDVSCVGTSLVRSSTTVGTCTITVATCVNNTSAECVTVTLDYAYRAHPLLPSLPGLGFVMPENLDYTAVAEVS